MAQDLSLGLREAIVAYIRSDAVVMAYLDQFYGERQPADAAWPFGRYGFDTAQKFQVSGVDGNEIEVNLHVFAKGESSDAVKPVMKALVKSLDDAQLSMDEGGVVDISFVQSQTLPDGPDGFHGIVTFTALVGVVA